MGTKKKSKKALTPQEKYKKQAEANLKKAQKLYEAEKSKRGANFMYGVCATIALLCIIPAPIFCIGLPILLCCICSCVVCIGCVGAAMDEDSEEEKQHHPPPQQQPQ